jgi:hypothetical protein
MMKIFGKAFCGRLLVGFFYIFFGSQSVWGQGANFKFGEMYFDLTSTMSAQYNSNIFTTTEAQGDLILTPGINIGGNYQLSELNNLSFGIGAGCQIYMKNHQLSSFDNFLNISPNSNVKFQFMIDNMTVVVYENFSFSTDPTNVLLSSGAAPNATTGSFARFNLVSGVQATLDMNAVQAGVNISQTDVLPFGTNKEVFKFTQSTTRTVSPFLAVACSPNLVLGLQSTLSINSYLIAFQNNSTSASVGPYLNWQFLPNMSFSGSASYIKYHFSQNGSNGDSSQPSGLEWQANLLNIATERFQHRIFITNSYEYGYISNTTQTHVYGYSFTWDVARKVIMRNAVTYDTGKDSGGSAPENFQRWTLGAGFTYSLNSRIAISLDYVWAKLHANLPGLSYSQNQVTLATSYDF